MTAYRRRPNWNSRSATPGMNIKRSLLPPVGLGRGSEVADVEECSDVEVSSKAAVLESVDDDGGAAPAGAGSLDEHAGSASLLRWALNGCPGVARCGPWLDDGGPHREGAAYPAARAVSRLNDPLKTSRSTPPLTPLTGPIPHCHIV